MTSGEERKTSTRADLMRFGAAPWACALATLGLSALAPLVPLPVTTEAWAARVAFVIAFGWVSGQVLLTAALAAPLRGAHALVPALALGGALATLAVLALPPTMGTTALVALLLLGGGTAIGSFVGGRIEHAGHLGVVAVVSSIADVTSVLSESGPSAQILESAPALALLAIGAPMLGTADLSPILGVGDVVLAGLYLAASHRHGLSRARTLTALAVGLALTLAAVIVLERALPALPFLGAAIVVAHPEARLPPAHERRTAALGVLVILALAAWLWLR